MTELTDAQKQQQQQQQQKLDEEADAAAAAALEAERDPVKRLEAYLATLTPEVRAEIEKHTAGLKSALVSERVISKAGKTAAQRLKELEDAETVRKQADLTETQKATEAKVAAENKAQELQGELRIERIKNAVLAAAAKASFADPLDAYAMIDQATLEIDDAGKVTGVDEAIKALAKAKPYLLGEPDQPEFNLNGGDKGRLPKGANLDEIKNQKRRRYRGL